MKNNFFDWVKHLFVNESKVNEAIDIEDNEILVDEIDSYVLTETPADKPGMFTYRVFNPEDILVGKYTSKIDAGNLKLSEYKASTIYSIFRNIVKQEKREAEKAANYAKVKADLLSLDDEDPRYEDEYDADEEDRPLRSFGSYGANNSRKLKSAQRSMFDDDEDDWWLNSYRGASTYRYTPPPKSTGFLDKLNKSDTLVIHCADRSTDMLSQIYDGKGWDVLRDGNIDKNELHELLTSHDRIIMLGHGTSGGLINKQGSGYTIDAGDAPYLKDKKLFVIWCNADKFFRQHGIGQGQFLVDNVPSEKWESSAAGCGNISSELMLENITYWSKLCADVAEQALEGDVDNAVKYVRKNYLEQYGNHPVTIYNAYSTDKHDVKTPLPEYEFKGKPLEPKDYPYHGYDEEEFLKHPKSSINGNSPYAS